MAHKLRTAAIALGLVTCLAFSTARAGTIRDALDSSPTGKGWGEQRSNSASTTVTGNGINYHGGPLLLGTPNIYFIWYGGWGFPNGKKGPSASDSQTTVSLLNTFIAGLSTSTYEAINTTYYQGTSANSVSGALTLAAYSTDNYSQGSRLSDSQVQAIVASAITNKRLPSDPNGVYFVFTSSDVAERSGFCTRYCGWHTRATINGVDIKYSFVGNPDRCPSACEAQTTSPNGDSGGDGMANIVAHESEEAISDPDLNAWYDSSGNENADKCVWQFGTTYPAGNGSAYNETFGGLNWLIQMNWANVAPSGECLNSY